jgi:PKD repeat protein
MNRITILLLTLVLSANAQHFTKITAGPQSNDGGDSRSVNWIDTDKDGDLDLFISNGPGAKANNFLYMNNGDGTFTKNTTASVVNDPGSYDGSTWADFDNDGYIDVYTATWYGQTNSLHRQYGGTFRKVIHGDIATDKTYSETASWGDYDNDGDVDLYLANSAVNKANILYTNNGNGTFSKVVTGPIVTYEATSRSVDWFDYDNDNDLDLFVANEGGENNLLFRNDGKGVFVRITTGALVTDGGDSFGSSVGDIDNDGDMDVFVANHGNTASFLYRNNGNGSFSRITSGTVTTRTGHAVGSAFGDLDNDGDLDLMVANAFSGSTATTNSLYYNDGTGIFTAVDTGIVSTDAGWSYGVAFGDYDRDGDLDIATANCFNANQNNALYRNSGNGNAWLTVKAAGTVSNRSAIGTVVRVKATINGTTVWQYRMVAGQSGYCGQNLESHFGLRDATMIDSLVVRFPSGITVVQTNVAVRQVLSISEPVPTGYVRSAWIADTLQGRVPLTVQFINTSVADAGLSVQWQWDLNGDGINEATTKDASFTYAAADTYSVRLIASNGTTTDTLRSKDAVMVLRPITSPVFVSAIPFLNDTTIAKNGKVQFSVNVLDTSDSPITYSWSRNSVVQASVTNAYQYTSVAILPAPRVDTFRVTVSNAFRSVQKLWLVRVANTTVSVGKDVLVPEFGLGQNFPNPFNPSTTITFQVPQESFVSLKLYDTIGREIRTLAQGTFEQGMHSVEVDMTSTNSGVYLYRMQSGSFVETRKMMVTK